MKNIFLLKVFHFQYDHRFVFSREMVKFWKSFSFTFFSKCFNRNFKCFLYFPFLNASWSLKIQNTLEDIFFTTFFFTVLMCILDEMHSSEITSKNFINLFALLLYCWFLIQVFLKLYNNGPNIDLCGKPHYIFAKYVFFLSKLINWFRLFR